MGPSTSTPSSIRRAAVACRSCRAAKVRCLVSEGLDRCDRCISNSTSCIFARPTRTGAGTQQRRRRQTTTPAQRNAETTTLPSSPNPNDNNESLFHHATPNDPEPQQNDNHQPSPITAEIRARLVAAFATLKGKRGAPFSFVTSGETPSFGVNGNIVTFASEHRSQQSPPSLKLSWILRPLRANPRPYVNDTDAESILPIKMPSYTVSMTIGQTITDPLDGGILTRPASIALFVHFMQELNAKWEYILDPHFDTHDSVKQRSPFLFATILFCSAKFAAHKNGEIVPETDVFLQTRLCNVARNLAVRAFAEGDRGIETMQAFYLLAAWKEPDDDTSYIHSGYAFRILQDLDLEPNDADTRQAACRRRTWLALFRQDKQQCLFFLRTPSHNADEQGLALAGDLSFWSKMPSATPLDFIACCGADLRRLQSRLRMLVRKSSPTMLPCILEQMDLDLSRWRTTWQKYLEGEIGTQVGIDESPDCRLLFPGKSHLSSLTSLWEQSVRLNIASAVLRHTMVASMASPPRYSTQTQTASLNFDLPAVMDILFADSSGLCSSIEGAFETIRQLLSIQGHDLRRSPDCYLLLGPNASLYLCLLLCLPCRGVIGASFQTTAVRLIRELTQHMRRSVRSRQDTIALHAAYLESLVDLITPTFEGSSSIHELSLQNDNHMSGSQTDSGAAAPHAPEFDPPGVSLDLSNEFIGTGSNNDEFFNLLEDCEQNLHLQSLANFLNPNIFWGQSIPTLSTDQHL